jgi:hypothetical protein
VLFILWFVAILRLVADIRAFYGPVQLVDKNIIVSALPRSIRFAAVACAIALLVAVVTAIPAILQGNPETLGDRFVANNHGALVPLTVEAYRASLAAHLRFTAAIMAGFFGVAAVSASIPKSPAPAREQVPINPG